MSAEFDPLYANDIGYFLVIQHLYFFETFFESDGKHVANMIVSRACDAYKKLRMNPFVLYSRVTCHTVDNFNPICLLIPESIPSVSAKRVFINRVGHCDCCRFILHTRNGLVINPSVCSIFTAKLLT